MAETLRDGGSVYVLERAPAARRAAGALTKLLHFAGFARRLAMLVRRHRPGLLLLYDPVALLAWSVVRPWVRRPATVWYHNHDVLEPPHRRGSVLNRLAWHAERRALRWLDVFSLPADERRAFYPLERFRGRYVLLPNYPSLRQYAQLYTPKFLPPAGTDVRLIFQGFAGPGRALEAVIEALLPWTAPDGRRFQLAIKGALDPAYRAALESLARQHGVADRLHVEPYGPYADVPAFTRTGHIGLAIFPGRDAMNATLATASNKSYEYAALGLPVLLYDSPHFRQHLDGEAWAFFTDGTAGSLRATLSAMLAQYETASAAGRRAFLDGRNFEATLAPSPALPPLSGHAPQGGG